MAALLSQRELRYNDSRMKATRARNDYFLSLESTTAALSKYYDHDLGDIILVSFQKPDL